MSWLGPKAKKECLSFFLVTAQPQSSTKPSHYCFFQLKKNLKAENKQWSFVSVFLKLFVFNLQEKCKKYEDLQKLFFVQSLVVHQPFSGIFWVWWMFCDLKVVFSFCTACILHQFPVFLQGLRNGFLKGTVIVPHLPFHISQWLLSVVSFVHRWLLSCYHPLKSTQYIVVMGYFHWKQCHRNSSYSATNASSRVG